MATAEDLPYLIRLLDDKDPAVLPVVKEQISGFGGDISDDLAALGIQVGARDKKTLAELLAPGRRDTLRNEWLAPSGGASAVEDDWEGFENTLRQISDFLHDGVTLRPSLSDSLDLLVDEISADYRDPTAEELRQWLFARKASQGGFKGAKAEADAVTYFDLCDVIEKRVGNPTSLACLFMLVGARFGVQVDGCNYPGHFLNRISIEGVPYLVDAFHSGRKFHAITLLNKHPGISSKAKQAIMAESNLGICLLRYLTEMIATYKALSHGEDEKLFTELAQTLE